MDWETKDGIRNINAAIGCILISGTMLFIALIVGLSVVSNRVEVIEKKIECLGLPDCNSPAVPVMPRKDK